MSFLFFFFNAPATTEIYTLSLHDALPICIERDDINQTFYFGLALGGNNSVLPQSPLYRPEYRYQWAEYDLDLAKDRKSTRLNSSHGYISYAVFCLKKKKKKQYTKLIITHK